MRSGIAATTAPWDRVIRSELTDLSGLLLAGSLSSRRRYSQNGSLISPTEAGGFE